MGGSPLGGGHGSGTPLTSPTSKPADTEPKKLVEDKKDTKKREEKSLPKPLPTNNPVVPGAPAPTTPAPGAPAPATPKPAAGPVDTTVDVKGKKSHFPDAKTAKMAKLLAAADPNHPISLADAAAQSRLTPPVPGQDPGKQKLWPTTNPDLVTPSQPADDLNDPWSRGAAGPAMKGLFEKG